MSHMNTAFRSYFILKIKSSYSLRNNQLTQRWLSRLHDFRIPVWWQQRRPMLGEETGCSRPMALQDACQPMKINNCPASDSVHTHSRANQLPPISEIAPIENHSAAQSGSTHTAWCVRSDTYNPALRYSGCKTCDSLFRTEINIFDTC